MNTLHGISIYNPDRLSDDNFVENFVARRNELGVLLNGLRDQARGGETRHEIIIGSRGMGKSSMLRRIAIGVMADDLLRAHFMPLKFREEQYNIISLDTFWRNCGEALAEWCEANDQKELAVRLDSEIASPAWRDAEKAVIAFLDVCQKLGRRAVLLLDNLDLILGGLKGVDCWSLRRTLQSKNGPIVIGAAPHFLEQGGDRNAPFYEFFHPHILEPLSEAELLSCLRTLASLRKEAGAPVLVILDRELERLRTLFTLTGGNPRVLVLIYQLLERAESATIFADLEALLEQVTPYYKARIEEYQSNQQRAVIDAIALNWDPITSNALSQASGIEITTISSLLNRLRKDGFVEEVARSGPRSGYQITERFLNIWYLMRHGTRRTKQRLRWLTLFLAKLFSTTDLERMAAEAIGVSGQCDWHPYFREAVIEAYREARRETLQKYGMGDEVAGWAGLTARLSDQPGSSPESEERGRDEEAAAVYDEVVERFGAATTPAPQEGVARALVSKGVALGRLGRDEEAAAVFDEVVERFGAATTPALQDRVARALVNKGRILFDLLGRNSEAEAVYRHGLRLYPTDLIMKNNLAWVYMATERTIEAATIISELTSLDVAGLSLLKAALEIAQDNFGLAVKHLGHALDIGLDPETSDFFEDLLRLLRLGEVRGYGERLIGWLAESGNAERYAPVYGAFVAYVRGERFLLDLNPEVRGAARKLFDFLAAPRRRRKTEPKPGPKRRSRPRK
jgi:tetratricopeptide (TPR) repeat protein